MAIEIIPDKICPHCGGIKWTVSIEKMNSGNLITRYRCPVRKRELDDLWKVKNRNKYLEYQKTQNRRKVVLGLRKRTEQEKQAMRDEYRYSSENITDQYVTKLIRERSKVSNISIDITPEEILLCRNRIIQRRKVVENHKLYPNSTRDKTNKRTRKIRKKRRYHKRYQRRLRENLTDDYIKRMIILGDGSYGIKTSRTEISQEEINLVRESILRKRIVKKVIKEQESIKK